MTAKAFLIMEEFFKLWLPSCKLCYYLLIASKRFSRYIKTDISNRLLEIFNDSCNSLSATNTSCYNSIFFVQPFHIVGNLNGQFTTSAS